MAQFDLANLCFAASNSEGALTGFAWCKRAAEQELVGAQYKLAECYIRGIGTQKDDNEAVTWIERAATNGSSIAAFHLGVIYESGDLRRADPALALRWFERADSLGNVTAAYHLARIYEKGIGVPRNNSMALRYYERAAEHGSAGACLVLATAYQEGLLGVSKDEAKSAAYREKFAVARKNRGDRRQTILNELGIGKEDISKS